MSETALLEVRDVTKYFGGFAALSHVDLDVRRGERLGLIGPNGSGKTTLINCISGTLRPDGGRIAFDGREITARSPHRIVRAGIARTFQIPRPFATMNVRDNLEIPLHYAARSKGDSLGGEAEEILTLIGLRDKADRLPGELTQIDMRKLELARALAGSPRLLILDEVMAGLSPSELDAILAILDQVSARGITIIMIEHIMRAVTAFSQRLIVLDAGRKIADGEPAEILRSEEVERAYLGD